MKAKVVTGGGFSGATRYVTSKAGAEFIDGSQPSRADFLRECAALRSLRPDCKKPVLHFSLSLPDGEQLSADRWREAVERFRDEMQLADHSFFAMQHKDATHDHVHVIANKIGNDGRLWNTDKSAIRAQAACAKIEKEMGLTITRTLGEYRAETGKRRRVVRDGSTNEFRRTGQVKSVVERAIQKRRAEEKERAKHEQQDQQDRAAHRSTAIDNGRLAARQTEAERLDRKNGEANRGARKTSAAAALRPQGGLTGARHHDRLIPPPTLRGRLTVTDAPGGYHLTWTGRDRPTFHYSSADQRLRLLARPNEQNVAALFDCAREAGIDQPLRIDGTPEFQRLAAQEAASRGLLIDRQSLDREARAEYDRIFSDRASTVGALPLGTFERERQAERQRLAERLAAEQAAARDLNNSNNNSQRMRMRQAPPPTK